ncbi:uncharacterized protein LOC144115412 isoform X2 [Amblyomma americanum]
MWCVCGMRLRCLSGRKTFAEYNAAAAMNSSVSANSRWWCVPSTWPRTDFDATTATTATTASAPTAGLSISTPGPVQVKKALFNAKTSQKADKSQKVVPIKSVFIHRLLLQRHVAAPPKKNIPVEEPSLEGTKEVVVAELQLLASDTLSGVTYNTERVMCFLKVTFQDHCQHYVTLCQVISWEKISSRQLCAEAQLRFESTVDKLEVRLKKAAQVFSEQQGQDTSLVQISRHLQGSLDHFLITETALPTAVQVTMPHVYTYKNQSWIYGGTQAEVIALKNKNIEWAFIVCLLVYYLINLRFRNRILVCMVRESVWYGGMAGCSRMVAVFVQRILSLGASTGPGKQPDCDLAAFLASFRHSHHIPKSLKRESVTPQVSDGARNKSRDERGAGGARRTYKWSGS